MKPEDLPDGIVALILKQLETASDVCAAIMAHRAFGVAAALDSLVWAALSSHVAWRVRQLRNESCRDYCKRGHLQLRSQRLISLGGCDEEELGTTDVHTYLLGVGRWEETWLPALPRLTDAPAAASDGDTVYVLGGWDCPIDTEIGTPLADVISLTVTHHFFTHQLPISLHTSLASRYL